MKSTGIVRRIDSLGRFVIPIEILRNLRIDKGDPLEIFTTADGIVLRPHRVGCACCGRGQALAHVDGLALCPACIQRFQREAAQASE